MPGEFSVSAGQKVHFSQGNLQYVGTWRFAEHQYDYFGADQTDNHRDLFGWGTGNNPNLVSTNDNDYATFVDWGTNAISNGGNEADRWRTLTAAEWFFWCRDQCSNENGDKESVPNKVFRHTLFFSAYLQKMCRYDFGPMDLGRYVVVTKW